jgi:hypothetical protein
MLGSTSKRDEAGSHSFGLVMGDYYGYDEMVDYMRQVNSAIPARTKMVNIGKTVENRDTWGIQVCLSLTKKSAYF